ncbi:hypothetical protein [Kitasatospora sp. NPDC001547]|uniref:hypothetical protein n=1 Tax=Kitasatospora sp. NPDC001547 TaxID=3364015 RepID=UPI0036AF9DBF
MSPGTATFLVGAAFADLLALAFTTVALGAVTALRIPRPDAPVGPERRNQHPTRRTPT